MARPQKSPPPTDVHGRTTVVNLKGSIEQREAIESVSRRTGIPAATIVRRALHLWLTSNGHPGFPGEGDEEFN